MNAILFCRRAATYVRKFFKEKYITDQDLFDKEEGRQNLLKLVPEECIFSKM